MLWAIPKVSFNVNRTFPTSVLTVQQLWMVVASKSLWY